MTSISCKSTADTGFATPELLNWLNESLVPPAQSLESGPVADGLVGLQLEECLPITRGSIG